MQKYRKKPVEIEAMQWDGSLYVAGRIASWVGDSGHEATFVSSQHDPALIINTLEGKMHVSKGDYVIKGIKGEFYPCKPDIFEDSYDKVTSTEE